MSNDLVKRADAFRLGSRPTDEQVNEANRLIDRLSSYSGDLACMTMKASNAAFLEKRRADEAEVKLAAAVKAFKRIELSTDTREQGRIAMVALAELKETPSA